MDSSEERLNEAAKEGRVEAVEALLSDNPDLDVN